MNTSFLKAAAIIFVALITISTSNAQEVQELRVMRGGSVVFSRDITDIDSIIVVPIVDGVLINGVIWSTRNVDAFGSFAANHTDAGMFYQWNKPKAWPVTGDVSTEWDKNPPEATWNPANDPCPNGWRVPTRTELQSLIDAGSTWTTIGDVNGRFFGSGTNTIFLPAVGYRLWHNGVLSDAGVYGYYWSSTEGSTDENAYCLEFYDYNYSVRMDAQAELAGRCVRCVKK